MSLTALFTRLRRHRVPALMLILEANLACAVLSNVWFMLKQRLIDIDTSNLMAGQRVAVLSVCIVMLAATALGVVGLTSFWVGQRRAQIGIRRALGARRRDVLKYFQSENLLLSLGGGLLGVIGGYGLNLYLMRTCEFERLPLGYLGTGALALLLGQLAVPGPALKASRISPVVAIRDAWRVAGRLRCGIVRPGLRR